jgi:hypothetical protein
MPLQNRNINLARGLMQIRTTPIGPSVPRFAGHRKQAARASRQLVRLAGGWWLVLIYSKRKILLVGCW